MISLSDPQSAVWQPRLLSVLEETWRTTRRWPTFDFVAEALGLDAAHTTALLRSFPSMGTPSPLGQMYGIVHFDHTLPAPPDVSRVGLTVWGLSMTRHGEESAAAFVGVLAGAAQRWLDTASDPRGVKQVSFAFDDARDQFGEVTPDVLPAVGLLLKTEPFAGRRSLSLDATGRWTLHVGREVTRYRDMELADYLADVERTLASAVAGPQDRTREPDQGTSVVTMNPARAVEELTALRADADSDAVRTSGSVHDEWKAKVRVVMRRSLGIDSIVLRSFEDVRYTVGVWTGSPGEAEQDRLYFAKKVGEAAAYIDAAIFELQLDDDPEQATAPPPDAIPGVGQIFVVHGHDNELKESVARLLEHTTGREVVILHEQPDAGKTIIEKFEDHAENAVFAVVLLSPDDQGGLAGDGIEMQLRARQNVIFELGYFLGRLGRSRVVALYKPGVELPSDLAGVLYKPVDAGPGWRYELVKELRAAGIDADMNKA